MSSALGAQTRAEITMTLRRGESVLLVLGIPVLLLVFFSLVDVLPTGTKNSVDFLAPGVLALAVMSTAMVGLAIATAFERQYFVLKRIGTTPLGRTRLLIAKIGGVLVVELVQMVVVVVVGVVLGWRPRWLGMPAAIAAVVLATSAFVGLGMLMAGRMSAEAVLGAANGLYLVLLLVSGMMIPLAKLPAPVRAVARLLPSTAVAELLHGSLARGVNVGLQPWLVLTAWALATPLLAARLFRWE